ncbi:MAG: hypothetical protein C4547_14240 [Phycisphaerales bacterium]|nr:MAG: hypothetical protein C4547_14240 [Phycisphaerales bacterium]
MDAGIDIPSRISPSWWDEDHPSTRKAAVAGASASAVPGTTVDRVACAGRVRWPAVAAACAVACVAWAVVPYRAIIPPQIEADYCYQLIAADRCYKGLGLTSLQPVAPNQPWEWQYEWGFLTQWPIGYPLLICCVRVLSGCSTLAAAQWLAVAACGLAVVGWFAFVRRMLPSGPASVLVSTAAALTSLEAGSMLNPSTDTLLAGSLPFVLLAVLAAMERGRAGAADSTHDGTLSGAGDRDMVDRTAAWRFTWCGLLAGGLFWLRYASLFVPAGVGAYVAWMAWRRRGVRRIDVAVFALGAFVPIAALILVNHAFAAGGSLQSGLNLGSSVRWAFSPRLVASAWWVLTDLGYYDYRPQVHVVLAAAPMALVGGGVLVRPVRRAAVAAMRSAGSGLGLAVLLSLLALLVCSTALFGDKYDYVGLERYYLPVRPIYVALLAAPALFLRRRLLSMAVCAVAIMAASWTMRHDWHRTWVRWAAADRATAPSGAWAQAFEPGAGELLARLQERLGDDVILFSNFHDYLAVELGVAAYPLPPDRSTAQRWIGGIAAARNRPVEQCRALFVIDGDNRWRDYYLPSPVDVVERLGLTPICDGATAVQGRLWEFAPAPYADTG